MRAFVWGSSAVGCGFGPLGACGRRVDVVRVTAIGVGEW